LTFSERGKRTLAVVAVDLNVSLSTLKGWLRDAAKKARGLPHVATPLPSDLPAKAWGARERLQALNESHALVGDALHAWCREKGLYAHQLQTWRDAFCATGERAFLDFAGHTVPIINAHTGEITQAQIFVAVLGASSYTFACATEAQKVQDWVLCSIAALEYFGGVTRLLVPDQPRTVSARPDRYEPTAQRLFAEMCTYYGVALLPARPAKPRDKPKVEAAVLLVERWILARF
jgi:transposase